MTDCQLCEGKIKRGKTQVFENKVIEPPMRMELCSSCHAWLSKKMHRYIKKVTQKVKQVKPKKRKPENKKKRKLYKR